MTEPLYDPEAERAVIGGALIDAASLFDLVGVVVPDDFHDAALAHVWRSIVAIAPERDVAAPTGEVNTALLRADMQRRGTWVPGQYAGTTALLADIVCEMATSAHAMTHGRHVAELAARRRIRDAGRVMQLEAVDMTKPFEAVASRAVSAITTAQTAADSKSTVSHIGDGLPDVLDGAMNPDSVRTSVEIPFPTLDGAMGGLAPGRVTVLAARPGMGKSAMALQMALHAAAAVPVLVFSLEMPRAEIQARSIGQLGQIDSRLIEQRRLHASSEEVQLAAFAAAQALVRLRLTVDCATDSIARMCTIVRREAAKGARLVVLDYVQKANFDGLDCGKSESRQVKIGAGMKALKRVALDTGVHVLALAQIDRACEDGEQPALNDLRESGDLEQEADSVLFIYGPRGDGTGVTDDRWLYHAKQRNGPSGSRIPLLFTRAHTLFYEAPVASVEEFNRGPRRVGGSRNGVAA